jgi:oxaloacetate decarboxylase alpha subunit
MARLIRIGDETLRDAHQCLWGTRMTNEMMLPVCRLMDGIGFDAIDLIGGAVWDVSVRFLLEDPWERMRHVSRLITRTPLNAWVRGQSLWTFEVFPNDVVELAMERVAANGMRAVTLYDQFNDLKNVEVCIAKAKSVGLRVLGALVFTWSPVHTDAYYAAKAAEFVRQGVDEIVLKDPSGMLSETRVRTQVASIRAAVGAVPINIHSHCMTGRAPEVLIAGAEAGADTVHTAISPLAHAASHPPTEGTCEALAAAGFTTALDPVAVGRMAAYFRYVCQRWGKPRGAPVAFDPKVLEHQMPGGMISNLINQLRQNGIEHRLEEILAETARVRKDMGYAPVVSPTAQFMVTQAVMNVVQGERYKTVPDELRKYVLGYYGTPPAPVAQELLDRAVRPGDRFVEGRCGDLVPPALPRLRAARGPFRDDDDLLQAAFYGDEILRPLFAARGRADYTRHYDSYGRIDGALLAALKERGVKTFSMRKVEAGTSAA